MSELLTGQKGRHYESKKTLVVQYAKNGKIYLIAEDVLEGYMAKLRSYFKHRYLQSNFNWIFKRYCEANTLKKFAKSALNYNPNLNLDYFDIIDSKEKAYWLGWFFAEGHITKRGGVQIEIGLKDEILVLRFAKAIGFELSNINYKRRNRDDGSETTTVLITFQDSCFIGHLLDKELVMGKKSEFITLPDLADIHNERVRELYMAFFLGYFDGDGEEGSSRIYSNSYEFLYQIKKKFRIDSKISKQKYMNKIFVITVKYTINKIIIMSKSKLIIGIILVVVGGSLIPTGFFLNQMFIDQIAEGVPDALLSIEEEAIPSLEEQLPPLGTPDVLLGVEDGALTSLEAQLPVLTTPAVLDGLKDEFLDQLPLIINGTGAAQAINQTITGVAGVIGYPAAKDQFFNSPTFQATYGTPQGVSDYYDTLMGDFDVVNLGYTVTAQNNLLYGVGPLPGLITDLELGLGLLGYMQLVKDVYLGDQDLNQTMQLYYNATWTQLEYLAGYIKNYLWEFVVKPGLPGPIELVAESMFYAQWANASVVEDGIDLSLFKDTLPDDTKGFEAGVPNPTNLTILTCMDLWNVSNSFSFVNDSGILVWVGAMLGDLTLQGYLIGAFSLNPDQLLILLGWLGAFMNNLVPLLLLDETGYTVPELAQLAFYEQWANGTIQGAAVLPDGFLNELSAAFAGPPYFEVGLPSPSGLSLTETMNLWDEANAFTFVNMNGILVWLEAITNTTLQTALIAMFGISAGELTALLVWLGAFFTVRVPQLIEYETGYTIPELAQVSFYEQWANGTIQGLSILPDGFLNERDPPLLGPPYFEVGLTEGSTGLTVSQCEALWDNTSEYSLVTVSGINKWYQAESSSNTYDDLRTNNDGLSAAQMTKILDWLPQFRDEIVNALAKEELGLPMEPYALGNTLLIALGVGGGTLAVIGIVLLILSKRK